MSGTLHGSAVKDGTLDGTALDVNGTPIDPSLITELSKLNFKDGVITADGIDAKNITGDLITAINLSAQNAEFGNVKIDTAAINSLNASDSLFRPEKLWREK